MPPIYIFKKRYSLTKKIKKKYEIPFISLSFHPSKHPNHSLFDPPSALSLKEIGKDLFVDESKTNEKERDNNM